MLDRAGIILNVCAGVLMGLEFFIRKERAEQLSNWLDKLTNKVESKYRRSMDIIGKRVLVVILIILSIFIISGLIFKSGQIGVYAASNYSLLILNLGSILFSILFFIFIISKLLPFFLRLLITSPKGTIGAIGVAFFIIGNILQFWATY